MCGGKYLKGKEEDRRGLDEKKKKIEEKRRKRKIGFGLGYMTSGKLLF